MATTPGSLDQQLAEWKARLERQAEMFRPLSGGIDSDDLVQVAMIDVWHRLKAGLEPSMENAVNRMRNEVRRDGRQSRGGAGGPDVFEQLDKETGEAFLSAEGAVG
jgi:DNA-directed RNA polymerase specialized sigma24 family protein